MLGRYVATVRPFSGFSLMSRVSSAGLFVRINLFRRFIFRKNVHADFYGLSDIDSVVTDFDTNSDRAFNDKVDSLTHRRRRRVLEEINSVTSGSSSPGLSPPLRVFDEGTSQDNPDVPFLSVPEASS